MSNYKIEDVEGIGPVIGNTLRAAGISDTDSLLANSATPQQRKVLAEKTGLPESKLLKFANMVDLYRVPGIGSEYSELLEASGVDTVPELAQRNAANLTTALAAKNEEKKLSRRVPSESTVAEWITLAKQLPRIIQY